MKLLLKVIMSVTLIALFYSCQYEQDAKQILSDTQTKNKILSIIASDSKLSKEMMGYMMQTDNIGTMMKIMKDDPAMMQNMMSNMMETSKSDSGMMSVMHNSMMQNEPLMHKIMSHMEQMKNMKKMQ